MSLGFDDSDEVTGLPPLREVDPASSLLVTALEVSEGIVALDDRSIPACVFLSVRGLVQSDDPFNPQWGQAHLAIPRGLVPNVIAALVKGAT